MSNQNSNNEIFGISRHKLLDVLTFAAAVIAAVIALLQAKDKNDN